MHPFSPVVVSFYTLDTPYQQEVLSLMQSCEKLGIEARIEGKKSHGCWELNCAHKPEFILQKLDQLQRPLLWVDADAIFLKKPQWKDFTDCDLSVRIEEDLCGDHSSKVLSGTLFVNYTEEGLSLIRSWSNECQMQLLYAKQVIDIFDFKPVPGGYFWDQIALREVLSKQQGAKVRSLPVKYCTIFDLDEDELYDRRETIIEHHQASRRFAKLIQRPV
jgi:hypothetical protein